LNTEIDNEKKISQNMIKKTSKDIFDMVSKKDAQDMQIDSLQWIIDSKQLELERVNQEIESQKTTQRKLQEECDAHEQRATEQRVMVRACADSLRDARAELQKRNALLVDIRRHADGLTSQLLQLRLEARSLSEAKKNERKSIQTIKEKKAFTEDQIAKYELEIQNIKKEELKIQKEIEKLDELRIESEKIFADHQSELKMRRKEVLSIEKELRAKISEKVELESKLQQIQLSGSLYQKESENIKKDIRTANAKNSDLELQRIKVENEISRVKSKNVQIESRIKQYVNEIKTREANSKEVEKKVQKKDEELKSVDHSIQMCQKSIENLNKMISEIKEKNGGIDASPLEIEIGSLRRSIEQRRAEQRELERTWLRNREALVHNADELRQITQRHQELADKFEIKKREEMRTNKELESNVCKRKLLECQTEKLRNDLERLGTIYHRESEKVARMDEALINVEENFKATFQESQMEIEQCEQRISDIRTLISELVRRNYEADVSIGLWCEKLEILNEVRASVANPEVRRDLAALELQLHNLRVEADELKKKQEIILMSLQRIATYKSENLFSFKREIEDVDKIKSLKAASKANLDFKINEMKRKIEKNLKESRKLEVLIEERNKDIEKQKTKFEQFETNYQQTMSKIAFNESQREQIEAEKLLNRAEVSIFQEKLKKLTELEDNETKRSKILSKEFLETMKKDKESLKGELEDILSFKSAKFMPLIVDRKSNLLVKFTKEYSQTLDVNV